MIGQLLCFGAKGKPRRWLLPSSRILVKVLVARPSPSGFCMVFGGFLHIGSVEDEDDGVGGAGSERRKELGAHHDPHARSRHTWELPPQNDIVPKILTTLIDFYPFDIGSPGPVPELKHELTQSSPPKADPPERMRMLRVSPSIPATVSQRFHHYTLIWRYLGYI